MKLKEAMAIVLDLAEGNILEEKLCDSDDDRETRQTQCDAHEAVHIHFESLSDD